MQLFTLAVSTSYAVLFSMAADSLATIDDKVGRATTPLLENV